MANITDVSMVLNRFTGGNFGQPQFESFWKDGRVSGAAAAAPIAGQWTSLWQYEGQPGAGAAPTTVAVPTNLTAGNLGDQRDPGGVRELWLTAANITALAAGYYMIYDRLLHIGNLSGTVVGPQTVGGVLTRNTSGAGNQIWAEVYTQIGANTVAITASYTNQDGTAGQRTQQVVIGNTGFREAQRMIQMPLAPGDTGVQSVQSAALTATSGTAGAFGITLLEPLIGFCLCTPGAGVVRDLIAQRPGPVKILAGACLALMYCANTTTVTQVQGGLHFIEV